MKNPAPVVLFMIQEYEWIPALTGLLSELGVRVERVDSIRELQERWTKDSPDWVVVDAALSRVLAAHLTLPRGGTSTSPGLVIVSESLRENLAEVERRLARFASSVRTLSPVEVFGEISRSLQRKLPRPGATKAEPATILCVDDDPLYLKALARRLTLHGYRVLESPSASEALEAAFRARPDLAIVDILMPGTDGLELTERFSRLSSGPLPVVLLTGVDSEEAALEGFRRGARYLLRKSCDPNKVLDVVDYFVGDLDDQERRAIKERL